MVDMEELKKDLYLFEGAEARRRKILDITEREGQEGRNRELGKYQNIYSNKIQIALQYSEGGRNYWEEEELNKAFNKAVSNNFRMLLNEALAKVEEEYNYKKKIFSRYEIKRS